MVANNNKPPPKGGDEGKPSGKKKLLLLVLLVVLSLGGLGGGLVMALGVDRVLAMVTGGSGEKATADAGEATTPDEEALAAEGEPAKPAKPKTEVMPFKEIIVNITATTATGRLTSRFLKLNIALVYDSSAEGAERLEDRKIYLRDSFQEYLRQLSDTDLQGSYGLATLREELLRRTRAVSASEAPKEILIADLIVQ
jgi:flagellar FliL protein